MTIDSTILTLLERIAKAIERMEKDVRSQHELIEIICKQVIEYSKNNECHETDALNRALKLRKARKTSE